MLDDLRRAAQSRDDEVETRADVRVPDSGKLFGMTAVERMFLSIGVFGLVLVLSVLLLIMTDSIGL
jgi:hypothetical protein